MKRELLLRSSGSLRRISFDPAISGAWVLPIVIGLLAAARIAFAIVDLLISKVHS